MRWRKDVAQSGCEGGFAGGGGAGEGEEEGRVGSWGGWLRRERGGHGGWMDSGEGGRVVRCFRD